jgi:hypothetical protein
MRVSTYSHVVQHKYQHTGHAVQHEYQHIGHIDNIGISIHATQIVQYIVGRGCTGCIVAVQDHTTTQEEVMSSWVADQPIMFCCILSLFLIGSFSQ